MNLLQSGVTILYVFGNLEGGMMKCDKIQKEGVSEFWNICRFWGIDKVEYQEYRRNKYGNQ